MARKAGFVVNRLCYKELRCSLFCSFLFRWLDRASLLLQRFGRVGPGGAESLPEDGGEGDDQSK